MPEIKCHMAHTYHVSTTDWVATLILGQLRYARTAINDKIKTTKMPPTPASHLQRALHARSGELAQVAIQLPDLRAPTSSHHS